VLIAMLTSWVMAVAVAVVVAPTGAIRCALLGAAAVAANCSSKRKSPYACVQDDLARARQSFVMTTELHLTYLCVPITETVGLDWKRFENMLGTLQVRDWAGLAWLAGCLLAFC
jgi:hypothetical protein